MNLRGPDIGARVLLVGILPALVLAIALSAYFISARLSDLERHSRDRALVLARQIVANAEFGLLSGNSGSLRAAANNVAYEPDVVGVVIAARDGGLTVMAGNPSTAAWRAAERVPAVEGVVPGAEELIVLPVQRSEIVSNDEPGSPADSTVVRRETIGVVVLERSHDSLVARRADLLWASVGILSVVLISAAVVAVRIGRGVILPIEEAAAAVRRIGQGDLTVRLGKDHGGVLGDLASGVNEMAVRLESARDQLEQRVAEATRLYRQKKEEAESANQAKSRFLAVASHDLRQPVHALGMFATELAQHHHQPDDRRLIAQIERSIEALENLLDALLDMSKLEAGTVKPERVAFPLGPLLQRVEQHYAPLARAKGVRMRVRPCTRWVESDPLLLERILNNLVSNAVRYTERGAIHLAARRRGPVLCLELRDSGIGIPARARATIFQAFVQLHAGGRRNSEGLGLGLAIVSGLAQVLEHPIRLRSEESCGSTFTVEVPWVAATDMVPRQALERSDLPVASGLGVLVVDDDELACSSLASLLNSWDCQVVGELGMENAAAWLRAQKRLPDLIVCDCQLGGQVNGVELLDAFNRELGPHCTYVLITGDANPAISAEARKRGYPMLYKPVRSAQLRALVQYVVAQRDRRLAVSSVDPA